MAKNDELTVTNPSVDELKELETSKKKKEPVVEVQPEPKPAETVVLKPVSTVDLVTPEKVNAMVSEWEYPEASYAFSVFGKNGSQILENKEDVSPCERMILSLEEAKKVIDKGFTLRWAVYGYESSAWYNQILAKWNFNFFAAFIKAEIESGRLNKYSF